MPPSEEPSKNEESGMGQGPAGETHRLSAEMPTLLPSEPDVTQATDASSPLPKSTSLGKGDFGNYEILEEIARGGMGVVFKARHRTLNRLVALKMVLSGHFASPEALARFQIEAEAAASLDHSGITPIYETGEIDGQPFFVMKYVSGGSLESEIADYELHPRRSAELLVEVARAVHHAHERGVLHRDLKPNNILLTDDGRPLVTDFGLAKLVDRESDHTKTGAIMGTPAYMAPEQAAGSKEITTTSDIYSLGALLYRLLTGRPTYQAENPLDIVIKSLQEEPPQPRSLNPDVPVDLALICMKCLSRDPQQRYQSAGVLADDLACWLRGEAISVRPTSVGTLAGIWMKQNLQMAGTAALIGIGFGIVLALLAFFAGFANNFNYASSVYTEYFPSVTKPLLARSGKNPSNSFEFGFLMWPVLVMSCGLVVVLVTKPNSRNMAASVGLIAGVLCSGLMGMSVTIGPLLSSTIERTEYDIELLVQVARSNEDTSKYAQQAILHRYPDLEKFNEPERAELLARKVTSDLISGLPIGLWSGMAVMMTVAPAVMLGAMFCWSLTRQGLALWRIVLRYFDVAFACCLLLAFTILFVISPLLGANLYVPSGLQMWGTIAALAMSAFAAIRNWRWYLRMVVYAGWIGLVGLYFAQNSAAANAYQSAGSYVIAGNYEQAAIYVERSLMPRGQDPWLLLQAGVLQAKLGDKARYESYCSQTLQSGFNSMQPELADRAAKLCLLLPGDAKRIQPAIQLAEKAAEIGAEHQGRNWFFLVQAMAMYRTGGYSEVLEWADRIDRKQSFLVTCTMDIVAAMAMQQLGKHQLASEQLAESTTTFDRIWNEQLTQQSRENVWHDRLIFEIWRDEANSLLAREPALPGDVKAVD